MTGEGVEAIIVMLVIILAIFKMVKKPEVVWGNPISGMNPKRKVWTVMNKSTAGIEAQLEELRGSENFIGFCAFDLFLNDDESKRKDGVLKISRHNLAPETGFLKFTFIVDVYGDQLIRKQVHELFARFHDSELKSETDPDFMYIKPQEPESNQDKSWFIGEVFFHFDSGKGGSRENVYRFFLPFLTLRLPIEFRDLEWWETEEEATEKKTSAIKAITSFIKSKF